MEREIIEIYDHSWTYYKFGKGKEILYLIHGGNCDAEFLLPLGQELSEKYIIIIPDIHGSGGTPTLHKNNYVNVASALSDFIDAMTDGKSANFFGVSLGGSILLELAYKKPGIFRRLIAQSPIWHKESLNNELLQDKIEWNLMSLPVDLIEHLRNKFTVNLIIREFVERKLPKYEDMVRKELLQLDIKAILTLFKSLCDESLEKKVAKISVPTVLLAGTADKSVLISDTKDLAERIPESKFIPVENATHDLILENSKKLAEIIEKELS